MTMRIFKVILALTASAIQILPLFAEDKPITVNFRTMPTLNCESYEADNWKEECNKEKQRRLSIFKLDYSGNRFSNASIAGVSIYPNLSYLNLSESRVNDNGLAYLLRNQRLQSLNLSKTAISDRGAAYLARIRSLKVVNLNATDIDNSSIQKLKPLQLLSLKVGLTQVTVSSLQTIVEQFKGLKSLGLSGVMLKDRDLLPLVGIQDEKVFELAVDEASVNPILALFGMGSKRIAVENTGLTSLQELDLSGTEVSGEFIWILTIMDSLRYLNLSETEINDETIGLLGMLQNLEALSLNNTKITDDGIEELANMSGLRAISLKGLNITADTLDVLAEMDSIEQVYLKGTNLPIDALQKFQDKNPDIKIYLD